MRSNKCNERDFDDPEEQEECFLKIKYFSK